jgi:hypothetical protein
MKESPVVLRLAPFISTTSLVRDGMTSPIKLRGMLLLVLTCK